MASSCWKWQWPVLTGVKQRAEGGVLRSRPTYFSESCAHKDPVTQPHGQTVALRGPIFSQRPEHGLYLFPAGGSLALLCMRHARLCR